MVVDTACHTLSEAFRENAFGTFNKAAPLSHDYMTSIYYNNTVLSAFVRVKRTLRSPYTIMIIGITMPAFVKRSTRDASVLVTAIWRACSR